MTRLDVGVVALVGSSQRGLVFRYVQLAVGDWVFWLLDSVFAF